MWQYGADVPPHLRYTVIGRGYMHMPELNTNAHGALHLSESSTPKAPHAWLRASAARSLDNPRGGAAPLPGRPREVRGAVRVPAEPSLPSGTTEGAS